MVLNLYPKLTLHDVFTGKTTLEDAILPAPGGFSVLLAGSGMVEYSRLTPEVRDQLQEVIDRVRPRFDRVLLDTGAGISDVVLYTVSLADEVLVVATPGADVADRCLRHHQGAGHHAAAALDSLLVNQVQRPGEARAIRKQLQQVVDRYVNPGLDTAGDARAAGRSAVRPDGARVGDQARSCCSRGHRARRRRRPSSLRRPAPGG